VSDNTSKNSFIRVRLFNVPSQFEDVITGHSFDFEATGVTEALSFSQPDLTYDADIIYGRTHCLDIYFPQPPKEQFFLQLKEWVPHLRWEVVEEENKDWLAEWKKGFVPFQLVGPYWVVPSWFEAPPEAEKPIWIDPGMAFGTGTHATTKMAAYFVNKLCSTLKNPGDTSLLDVGTGTGILAMLAAYNNLALIKGIEIDPEARRVARENIAKNKFEKNIEITDELAEDLCKKENETYDIVVANIIDGVLINIKSSLLQLLSPGGNIFLTGILLEREDVFLEEFIKDSGLTMVRRIEKDEWVGFWLQS
jgi:ribosomal protein L11 methyltransferase